MSWENVPDLRRVGVEHMAESWENGASGTGASTPARTDRSSTSTRRKEPRLMPDSTFAGPACTDSRAVSHAPYKKKAIPNAVRRAVALKYGCPPGETTAAPCHYCGGMGRICWHRNYDGTPNYWVSFDHELDHVRPEFHGGPATVDNLVLACRTCNRRKGARV